MKRNAATAMELPWPAYGLDWCASAQASSPALLAVSSFKPQLANECLIVGLDSTLKQEEEFRPLARLTFEQVATRVRWSPPQAGRADLLAVAGEGVNLWRYGEGAGGGFVPLPKLVSRPAPSSSRPPPPDANPAGNPPAPLTGCAWSPVDPSLLVTASYDTTCTVWSVGTEGGSAAQVKTQLIAHDKEVMDVAMSPTSADCFASVGADGSLRLFDTR